MTNQNHQAFNTFHIPTVRLEVDPKTVSLAPTRSDYTFDIYVGDKLRQLRLCRSSQMGCTQLFLDDRLLYSRNLADDAKDEEYKFDFDTSGMRLKVVHAGSQSISLCLADKECVTPPHSEKCQNTAGEASTPKSVPNSPGEQVKPCPAFVGGASTYKIPKRGERSPAA